MAKMPPIEVPVVAKFIPPSAPSVGRIVHYLRRLGLP